MDFDLSPDDLAWRDRVQVFLAEHVTDDVRSEVSSTSDRTGGPRLAAFWRRVGAEGWLAINWPAEWNGTPMSATQRLVLADEFEYAGLPPFDFTITSLAPVILRYGTDENRAHWLPRISTGEVTFALGYSEPEAGTDLASLTTRAERSGGGWLINGQKIWNSGAHRATHEWLAVRTDPHAPPHSGISILLVPIDARGVDVVAIDTWSDERTNLTTFTDVWVPDDHLIGEVNAGWRYITGALDNERGSLGSAANLRVLLDALVEQCRTETVDGTPLIERTEVRLRLARLEADLQALETIGWSVAQSIEAGTYSTVPATIHKITATEMRTRISGEAIRLLGLRGVLTRDDPTAPAGGLFEHTYRVAPRYRFGGGTNEVLRDVIAQRGFGLPRPPRRAPTEAKPEG